jgi:hypothetical protein
MNNKSILFFMVTLAIQSCATNKTNTTNRTPPNAIIKVVPAQEDRIQTLLHFYETYSNLGLEAQKNLFNESTTALNMNKNDLTHRIKMATMLAIPTSQLRDAPKAESLLQDLMSDANIAKQELAYIGLLYEFTQESRKLQQKFRDESKRLDLSQQKNESLSQKIEALQQKNVVLEQKLLEIKNIEKSLSDRDTKTFDKTKP